MSFNRAGKIGFGGFREIISSSSDLSNLGDVLATDIGGIFVTEGGIALEVGQEYISVLNLTYFWDGSETGDDYCNNGGGSGIGIYSTGENTANFMSRIVPGSVIELSDGSTTYTYNVVSLANSNPIYSITVVETISGELFTPDGTAVTLTRIA